ncbi:MAG: bifunctional serine/threonine-protein kinase/formylglycine-generating enzyme family protein [Chloracidobacterium sp.]|nr:bifunctional serine/threonine-protein kinase/formylglycine-generating enzyme family protein [Chloracidobacterium sp.]MDW8217228.1 bifunctional serine/threonine-protein kinase/formylglycine-generating enzyme family protein [Acidobacteriota bacterium]
MALLKNQYRLLQELGSGAFGRTYLAEDTHSPSNRRCVIKHLTWNHDPQLAHIVRERFKREAILLEKLGRGSQGGIPELYAYFTEGEEYYLVQEWIDGETLTQKLRREGPQSEAALVSILLGTLRILDYIHTLPTPVIHRDIKPDNIMLRRATGQPVLIDFGVVKEITAPESTGAGNTIMAGTSGYMPLEQAAGRPTFASDIYALGMTAITLATGRHPRELVNPISGEVTWRAAAPQIRPALAATLDIAVRRSDRDRYQTARDFAMAIQAALSSDASAGGGIDPTVYALGSSSSNAAPLPPLSASLLPTLLPPTLPLVPSNPSVSPTPAGGVTDIIQNLQAQQGGAQKVGSSKLFAPLLAAVGGFLLLTAAGVTAWWLLAPTPSQRSVTVKSNSPPDKKKSTDDTPNKATPTPPPVSSPPAPAGMVFIAGGTFRMGRDDAEHPSEKPSHVVTVRPFFIDKHEVTNAEYEAFIKATQHPAPPDWVDGSYPAGMANYPVVNVSWQDACDYAAWAGKRLPTEEEWEMAARGVEGRLYPWGNQFDLRRLNIKESNLGRPKAVGNYPTGATPEGVLDLAGNVAEWTASDDKSYPGSAYKPETKAKIVRGGAFSLSREYATATKRTQVPPDTRDPALGFRCVKDLPNGGRQL